MKFQSALRFAVVSDMALALTSDDTFGFNPL